MVWGAGKFVVEMARVYRVNYSDVELGFPRILLLNKLLLLLISTYKL